MRSINPTTNVEATLTMWGATLLRRWWLMAIALLGGAAGAGMLGLVLLLQQPPKPNCNQVFWPFASGSLRITCAQEFAQKQTLEDLFEAIALIDGLSSNHPLRPLIDRWLDIWAKQALDLAEAEFDAGKLDRAIYFAKKIPVQSGAHKLVAERIQYWEKVWAQGKEVYGRAEATLKAENWRQAFGIMIKLLAVDNRYWSQTQYESLNQRIIQAQKDEVQLVKAKQLLDTGGVDNLTKALDLVRTLSDGTIFQKSVQTTIAKISRKLIDFAEMALTREDLNVALDALEQIPRDVSFWPEVQDWIDVAHAMADTWSDNVVGYEAAIAQVRKIGPDRPLYLKAQDLIQKWSNDITYVRVLEEAQAKAADGSTENLALAIEQVRQIPSDSSLWKTAQTSLKQWDSSLNDQQDQPILDQADTLSFQGDPKSLQQAIQTAQQIPQGHPLYADAQSRIKDWQSQLNPAPPPESPPPKPQDISRFDPNSSALDRPIQAVADSPSRSLWQEAQTLAQKGTPTALASAMETAHQIPTSSRLYGQAQQAIESWGSQMLELANSRANYDLPGAIAIAQQIPAFSPAYDDAQQRILDWQDRNNSQ